MPSSFAAGDEVLVRFTSGTTFDGTLVSIDEIGVVIDATDQRPAARSGSWVYLIPWQAIAYLTARQTQEARSVPIALGQRPRA